MKLEDLLARAGDTMTVRRVFAEPYERNGVTVIPGAMVSGGGGGGGGHDEKGQEGQGGGFGMNARPAGAFVIKEGNVAWRPAVDVNRLLMVAGAVAVASVVTWGRIRTGQRGRMRGGSRMAHQRGLGGGRMMRGGMMRGGMMRGGMMRGGMMRGGMMGGGMMAGRLMGGRMMRRRMIDGGMMGGRMIATGDLPGRRGRMGRSFLAADWMTGRQLDRELKARKRIAGKKGRKRA